VDRRERLRIRACRPTLLGATILLILCAHGGSAQPVAQDTAQGVAERVDRLLRSDAPRDIAWGAVLSAQYQVRAAVPLLEAALARTYDVRQPAAWAVEQALLDALVQLDARLPAASVRPYFGRWPVQTLILLANASSGRDAMLLPLVSTTSGSRWHVVSNLLMQTRPSGFAFQLLNGLRLKLTVQVVDRDDFSFERNTSGMTRDRGVVNPALAADFPPVAYYEFASEGPAATVIATGPVTVYYRRGILPAGLVHPPAQSGASFPSDFERIRYANALVRRRFSPVPLFESHFGVIVWTNAREFDARIVEHRRRVEETYRETAALLVRSEDLSDEEARRLEPDVEITILDRRSQPTEILPPTIR
jgi:hypothetical protein